ncbi:MAG: penicillin-binding protein 2 [Candidatus Omnitrophica bacterium]|nr:penicillin-binding protein 2 [Candidatus Omnitrophota bacterium]
MLESRLQIVTGFMVLSFLFLLTRLFSLHILEHTYWTEYAARQHRLTLTIPPDRGMILDRNGKPLATSKLAPSVYGVPYEVTDIKTAARTISPILGEKSDFITERLAREKSFVWIKRQVTDKEVSELRRLAVPGIAIRYENKRFYPQGELLAPVLGFCSIDETGLEGIELAYNHYLAGRSGERSTRRDALGRPLAAFDQKLISAVDGHNITLTVDRFIQFHTEVALREAIEKWKAKGGMAVVINPHTGEILAIASLPSFDPNNFQDVSTEQRRNKPITDYYEPGSTFKFITASAALETQMFTFDSRIYCENGAYKVSSHILHDVKPYGEIAFPEVFINSSNIGTVKIAQKVGAQKIYSYVKKFGFGEKTLVDLLGEEQGVVYPPEKWSKLSISAIPIGHEVGVTALQVVRAISVIANGGKLMRPYIIKEVRDQKNGMLIERREPVLERRAIEPETAKQVNEILKRVIEEGTGKQAKIPGIAVAGKTGTAQKLNPDGKTYAHDRHVSSFVGYVPADDPRYAMVVVIDEPKGKYYGGTVAAPVFKAVLQEVLLQEGILSEARA